MKILHTADWHLGDRLGRIDRTDDLRRAVERVARLCDERQVDVLLVAGDIFSELARPDSLRGSIEHVQRTFEKFLIGGGTILAVTGNHDNETFCQTLHLVMTLAAPTANQIGELHPPGRLYLATQPDLLRLADRDGTVVQFLLMPYPMPVRYLREEEAQKFASLEEKNKSLQAAYTSTLQQLRQHPKYDAKLPTVLAAHIHVQGAILPSLFRISEQESIIFNEADLPVEMDYIALGHIHQPITVMAMPHIRYSSSIEKLDLGERKDQKGVVLVDIGPQGRRGEPEFIPLPSTAIYAIDIQNPAEEIPKLRDDFPNAQNDLVNLEFCYTAGKDNLEQILKDLEEIFPRWYSRNWTESGALGPTLTVGDASHGKSFEETVRDYLTQELTNHGDEERHAVLNMAEELMRGTNGG
jgi:exonuclease SbcD